MAINWIDILIIIVYILGVTAYGLWRARAVKSSEDFLVAGRSLGLFVLVGTLVMTEFNTGTFIGYSVFGYNAGVYGSTIAFCFIFGLLPYTFIVASRWNRLKAISINEMFEQRFSKKLRVMTSLMVISCLALFSTAYLKAASLVFSTALGLDLAWTVILISVVVLIFTLAGGLISVSWTNFLSFIMTLIVFPILFIITFYKSNSLGGLSTVFDSKYLSANPIGMWNDPILSYEFIFTVYMLLFLIYMVSPWYAQIMFATKDEKTAYKGMFFATVLIILFYFAAFLGAAYGRVGFPDLADPQTVYPRIISEWMPLGIKGLTLALIFSVCQTTMASIWNNSVSIIVQDIYQGIIRPNASDKNKLIVSRIMTLIIACFTIIVSIFFVKVIYQVFFYANIFMVSLFFACVGGFLWWKIGQKAAWATAILGVISGWLIFSLKELANDSLPTFFQNHDWLFLYCVIITPIILIIGVIISFVEKQDKEYLAKKVAFFTKVGEPWFGKNEFYRIREGLKNKVNTSK